MEEYAQVPASSFCLRVGPKIDVVYGVGSIVTGESGTGVQGDVL